MDIDHPPVSYSDSMPLHHMGFGFFSRAAVREQVEELLQLEVHKRLLDIDEQTQNPNQLCVCAAEDVGLLSGDGGQTSAQGRWRSRHRQSEPRCFTY